jgi:drug/metabolite transporter (DMT)-like permease
MPSGLLAGLGAALAWGTMDIASALASRAIGSLRVMAGIQAVGAVLLGLIAVVTRATLPADPATLAICALLGVIGTGAYLAYFTGLRVGPISVVSGMVAAYGGLTVVLAVAALILFSLMAITTDIALEHAGWLQVLLVSRLMSVIIAGVAVRGLALAARRRGTGPAGELAVWRRQRVAATLVVAGTLDVAGLISFTVGLERAPTWMVGLASSFGPAVTIVVAVAMLGERLKPVQWLGLVGIAVGMVAIAVP